MVVLVDERPEEVTDMQRTVKGEVIASTFDRPAEDHTTVAELAIERAKRLVELGHDVVVLLDSITRLGRAYNLAAPGLRSHPVRWRRRLGALPAEALLRRRAQHRERRLAHHPRDRARRDRLEDGRGDLRGVQGHRQLELRLSRQLADKRIFPAVDVNASGTRREEMLLGADEVKITWKLRRALAGLDQQQAARGRARPAQGDAVERRVPHADAEVDARRHGAAALARARDRPPLRLRVRVRPGRCSPSTPSSRRQLADPALHADAGARQEGQPALRRAEPDRRGAHGVAAGGRRPRGGTRAGQGGRGVRRGGPRPRGGPRAGAGEAAAPARSRATPTTAAT